MLSIRWTFAPFFLRNIYYFNEEVYGEPQRNHLLNKEDIQSLRERKKINGIQFLVAVLFTSWICQYGSIIYLDLLELGKSKCKNNV